jgi:redox-sensitive bicupin YhaK (pirin superfamily)
MTPPRYQDVPAARIASAERGGARIRVIAGDAFGVGGAASTLTPVRLLDVTIGPDATFEIDVPDSHACFVYVYEGTVRGPDHAGKPGELKTGDLAVLEGGGSVTLVAGSFGARLRSPATVPL